MLPAPQIWIIKRGRVVGSLSGPSRTNADGCDAPLVVFHHPGPVTPNGRAGSQVRPWQLLQAFREEEYEVMAVVGYGTERRRQIKTVLRALRGGRKASFVYSESRSIPTLLTETHRLPFFPAMDFQFLRAMRKAGVPVGLFYRDVFWRFHMYRTMLPLLGRALTIPLYHYDWWWYRHSVDHMFLPSFGMATHLPTPWPMDRLSALPPGTSLPDAMGEIVPPRRGRPLTMLYIGGTRPPSYDLKPLFAAVAAARNVELILCCRPDEWEGIRTYYVDSMSDRVLIVHRLGEELQELYARADIFSLLRSPHEYLDFAVPVKLFESIGHGLPILTLSGTEAARMVDEYNLGWVVSGLEEATLLLQRLQSNPSLLEEKRASVARARREHTWVARVREVAKHLGQYDRRDP